MHFPWVCAEEWDRWMCIVPSGGLQAKLLSSPGTATLVVAHYQVEAAVSRDPGGLLPAVHVSLHGHPRSGGAVTSTAACPQVGQRGSCTGAGALALRPPSTRDEFLLQSRFTPGSSQPSSAADLTPEQGDTVDLLCLQTPGLCSGAPPDLEGEPFLVWAFEPYETRLFYYSMEKYPGSSREGHQCLDPWIRHLSFSFKHLGYNS